MNTAARPWLGFLLLVLGIGTAAAQAPATVPAPAASPAFLLEPPSGLEAALILESRGGPRSGTDLLGAALLASGVPQVDVPAWQERIHRALEPARLKAAAVADPVARGRALLRALHHTLFRSYAEGATSLVEVMTLGHYNCVSSAVLFVVAAQGLLDQPRAMLSSVHAFARVSVAGRPVDVETTVAEGFAPDRKRLTIPALQAAPEGGGAAQEMSTWALVAAIYSNRAVDLLSQGDVAACATALDRSFRFAQEPQRAPLARWRAALINNAGLALLANHRPRQAVLALDMALQDAPEPLAGSVRLNLAAAWLHVADDEFDHKEFLLALQATQKALALTPRDRAAVQRQARAVAALAAQEGNVAPCAALPVAADAAECLAHISGAELAANRLDTALAAARLAVQKDPHLHNAQAVLFNALNRTAERHMAHHECAKAQALWREAGALRAVAQPQQPWTVRAAACWFNGGVALAAQGKDREALESIQEALALTPEDAVARKAAATCAFNVAVPWVNSGQCDLARPWIARALQWDGTREAQRDKLLAACALRAAQGAWERKDPATTEAEARRGLLDVPGHADLQRTLAAALYSQARTAVEARQCTAARPFLAELETLREGVPDLAPLHTRCDPHAVNPR